MKEKNLFGISNEIIEISTIYEKLAKNLVSNFNLKTNQDLFIEIDCAPNVGLNVFRLGNGINSAKLITNISGSFLGSDRKWLEEKIEAANNFIWQPSYHIGENLGLWKKVEEDDYKYLLDWNKPFCVKNIKGLTKIWHPEWRKFSRTGFATRSSIIRFITEETVYLQPFFIPLTAICNPDWHMTYRLVFFSNGGDEPEFIGGLWISRSGFKVYPDKNSTVGLISTKKA